MILMFCVNSDLLAQTDEELREEIRNEILEEQRLSEEKELLEYRKAKIRREEEARIEAEKAALKENLLKKAEPTEPKPKKEVSDKETYLEKRLYGWAISVHVGPGFGVGDYGKTDGNGWYAGVGPTVQLTNYIHFGKYIGIFIGLSYEYNILQESALERDLLLAGAPDGIQFSITNSTPHSHYSAMFGPSIRFMGKSASVQIRPHLGLSVSNATDYTMRVTDANTASTLSYKGKTTTRLAFGAAFELAGHVSKSSDIVVALISNNAIGSVPWEISSTTAPTQFGSSEYDPLRLALLFGYRFHL